MTYFRALLTLRQRWKSFHSDLYSRLDNLPIGEEDAKEAIQLFYRRSYLFSKNMGNGALSFGKFGRSLEHFVVRDYFLPLFSCRRKEDFKLLGKSIFFCFSERKKWEKLSLFQGCRPGFAGYLRGQIIDGFIMAVLVSITLSLLGVRYALVIGVLTDGNLIPYMGPFIAYGLTILVCVLYGEFAKLPPAVIALLSFRHWMKFHQSEASFP